MKKWFLRIGFSAGLLLIVGVIYLNILSDQCWIKVSNDSGVQIEQLEIQVNSLVFEFKNIPPGDSFWVPAHQSPWGGQGLQFNSPLPIGKWATVGGYISQPLEG